VKLPFCIGEQVWLRVDGDITGIITSYTVRRDGIIWHVSWCNLSENGHFDFELTDEKPIDGVYHDDEERERAD